MGNILMGILILLVAISILFPKPANDTQALPQPPDADYIFKKDKSIQPSSESSILKSREQVLNECKQEFKLAEMIMVHRQMNMSMIKSLELIYKDPQFSEDLKGRAKNAVVIAQDVERSALSGNRQQTIKKFATDAQKNCLLFSN